MTTEELLNPEESEEDRQLPVTTPGTFMELAFLKGGPKEVANVMVEIAETFRRAAIHLTFAEDWLLFRAVDKQSGQERVTGYLQDSGCNRANKIWGVQIHNVSEGLKKTDENGAYTYVLSADGFCVRTQERIEKIIGSRSSTDDIVDQWRKEGFPDSKIEIQIQKAARANLDGNIIRELTGLDSVPVEELEAAGIDTTRCVYGRGFRAAKVTAGAEKYTDSPDCPAGHGKLRLIPAGTSKKTGKDYSAFWACDDRSCKETVQDSQWNNRVSPADTSSPSQGGLVSVRISKEKLEAIETMKKDPLALEIIGSDGKSMADYLGNLIIDDLSEQDVDTILLRTKTSLEQYRAKKGVLEETQEKEKDAKQTDDRPSF